MKREVPLSLHYKLFGGAYVPDIVTTSSPTSTPATSIQTLIQQLKDTCKELDGVISTSTARKFKLEFLIKSLTREEAQQVGKDNVGAASESAENEADNDDSEKTISKEVTVVDHTDDENDKDNIATATEELSLL